MNMLVSTAAVATAMPVAAAQPEDPIFAAIERHRRAYRAYMDSFGEDEIEDAIPADRRRSCMVSALHGASDWQVAGDDPKWLAHIETACRTSTEQEDAAIALVSFESLSLTGAAALLQYAVELETKDKQCWPELCDDDNKPRSFQLFLMKQVAGALTTA